MKKFLICIYLIVSCSTFLDAQELMIKSLSQIMPNEGMEQRVDNNGDACALLDINVDDKITLVQGNIVGDVVSKGKDKYVYLADGTKIIKINFMHHFPLELDFSKQKIARAHGGACYLLELSGTAVDDEASNKLLSLQDKALEGAEIGDYLFEDKDKKAFLVKHNDFKKHKGAGSCIGLVYSLRAGDGFTHGYAISVEDAELKDSPYKTDYLAINVSDPGQKFNEYMEGMRDTRIESADTTCIAATSAYRSQHPINTSKWFIPSIGQWIEIVTNLGQLTDTLTKAGIVGHIECSTESVINRLNDYTDKIHDDNYQYTFGNGKRYWSSTVSHHQYSYYIYFSDSDGIKFNLDRNLLKCHVRQVIAF